MKINYIAVLCFCVLVCSNSLAQDIFKITRSTFSNGGGQCANSDFRLNGTVSQSFIGKSEGVVHQGKIGFWYRAPSKMTTSSVQVTQREGSQYLRQNEPNPFFDHTKIGFELPKATHVKLRIFDPLGRELVEILDEKMPAGYQEIIFDAQGLPDGTYLYRLSTDQFFITKKMVVCR